MTNNTSPVISKRHVFMALFTVNYANPNGDPVAGNMPRTLPDGRGLVTAVCIKRKLRNRLQDMGHSIAIVSDGRYEDGINNIYDRCMANPEVAAAEGKGAEDVRKALLRNFIDCRAFGGVLAAKPEGKSKGVSIGIRGAVSMPDCLSLDPVVIHEDAITKSVNGVPGEKGISSDRFGAASYSVEHGLYVIRGSVSPWLAEKNGFSEDDLEAFRTALMTLFENDESAARPAGTMAMGKVVWWEGDITNNGISRLYDSVKISVKDGAAHPITINDYEITVDPDTNAAILDCG